MKDNRQALYQQMAEFTLPACQKQCRVPLSCCSPEYCDIAIDYAKEVFNITLSPTNFPNKKNLKLMGQNGCTAAPHLRPLCTLHTCKINSFGFTADKDWDEKYFSLREAIMEEECKQRDKE